MDGAPVAGGGPAPFLLKTYDMVDDSSTDEIVSWSSSKNSFVVWNPPEFARILLPTYFKHNNFSSFIRQLNTYGFRKIDPEKWEFSNEDFVKDQKHLLKNIHRRKPIHSHSQPQGDPERAAFEEEIDKLLREKAATESNLFRSKQEQSAVKLQMEELTQRVGGIEQRQEKLIAFLEKAVQDRKFVEHLARKLESMDVSAYNKKRRLPEVEKSRLVRETSSVNNHSSPGPELRTIFHQDFSNTLRLELSPAVSDMNLVSHSTQSSNEEGGSPQRRLSEGFTKDVQMRTTGFNFAPETLELSDTGTSFTFKMSSSLSCRMADSESPTLHPSQHRLHSNDDGDGVSCQLNLTLASSSLQVDKSHCPSRTPQLGQEIGDFLEPRSNINNKDVNTRVSIKNRSFSDDETTLSSSQKAPINNQGPVTAPVRVNDHFWEQFLTERPGSSDTEEASSSFRTNAYDDQEATRLGHRLSRNAKSMEHLTL